MRRAIVTGMVGLALFSNGAAAQSADERARILRDFEQRVEDYARQQSLRVFPEAINAATPAPKIFTPPVAMVFRQLIARAVETPTGLAIGGVNTVHRAAVLQPVPPAELSDFPKILNEVLPLLPAPLEYRLIGSDLAIRDANADVIIAVLRDALGVTTTRY